MTCFILYWFGSQFGGASIIKGFALTLAIGVVVSLITSYYRNTNLPESGPANKACAQQVGLRCG